MKADCPLCLGKDCVSMTRTSQGWKVTCHSPNDVLRGGEWLRAVAEVVGAPSGGHILANPPAWLPESSSTARVSVSGPLPDSARFDGYGDRLLGPDGREARGWLIERGISLHVIRAVGLGWNGSELVFPLRESDGELVNAKLRRPSAGAQMVCWPHRTGDDCFPLFPSPAGLPRVLLCEGELDALAAMSVGIPACSVTTGVKKWRGRWEHDLAGRRVAVCFDVGAERWARRAVDKLTGAAEQVWVVRLPGGEGDDVTDYLRDHSATELRKLIGRARDGK
jgi:hypothetical protein